MHAEAFAFVRRQVRERGPWLSVLEFGGRNVNGSVRPLFGAASYTSVDIAAGPGVDVVGDAAMWRPPEPVEVVVCCEVLEHAPDAAGIVTNAAGCLVSGGVLLLSAACDPRAQHSGHDGGPVRDGEHYANVDPSDLADWLGKGFAWFDIETYPDRGDVYAVAVKE